MAERLTGKVKKARVQEVYEIKPDQPERLLDDPVGGLRALLEREGVKVNSLELAEDLGQGRSAARARIPAEIACYHIVWPDRSNIFCEVTRWETG